MCKVTVTLREYNILLFTPLLSFMEAVTVTVFSHANSYGLNFRSRQTFKPSKQRLTETSIEMQWSQPLLFNIYCIDCNHCNMNLTVSLLPPRTPPCAAAVCCRALTTFHGPHYFQHCSRVPLSSHRRKILVQATSVNKRAMCIGCLCTSG